MQFIRVCLYKHSSKHLLFSMHRTNQAATHQPNLEDGPRE